MNYWPMSFLAAHPDMPWQFAGELYNAQSRGAKTMSRSATDACGRVAMHCQCYEVPRLSMTQNISSWGYMIFLEEPTKASFDVLERACLIADCEGQLWVHLASLH